MFALVAGAVLSAKCSTYCQSSCCSFSQPEMECGGCDSSYICSPGARCYAAEDRPPASPPYSTPLGMCESICEKASCCGFSEPRKSCSGCEDPYTCRPATECYEGGSAAASRHQHTPGGAAEAVEAAPKKRHEHAPQPKKKRHEHVPPAPAAASEAPQQRRKKRHEHTPPAAKAAAKETAKEEAVAEAAAEAPAEDKMLGSAATSKAEASADGSVASKETGEEDARADGCAACEASLASARATIHSLEQSLQRAETFAESAVRACDGARVAADADSAIADPPSDAGSKASGAAAGGHDEL